MMKRINKLEMMLLGITALFYSCQENEQFNCRTSEQNVTNQLTLSQYGVFPQSEEFKIQSRALNSTFETDWENNSVVTLVTGQQVNLPWSDNASANFAKTLACDVKKEDGWQMIYHSLAGSSNADDKHYIMLYNQRTGFLKVFAYATTMTRNNTGFWYMYFLNNQQMLNATTEIALPADLGNISIGEAVTPQKYLVHHSVQDGMYFKYN